MADKVLASLHPDLRRKVRAILRDVAGKLPPGVELVPYCGYRSPERQSELFCAGRTRTLAGKHNQRPAWACDLVFQVAGKWSWDPALPWDLIGSSARAHGLIWGGDWLYMVDWPHVELGG